jgi:hypothetical protein
MMSASTCFPATALVVEPEDPCIENPDAEGCPPIDPYEVSPDAEGCQEPTPPIDPCEENPSLPECQGDIGEPFSD